MSFVSCLAIILTTLSNSRHLAAYFGHIRTPCRTILKTDTLMLLKTKSLREDRTDEEDRYAKGQGDLKT
jgi:hypothetical protein